ncbi:MAG: hypothetical protein AB7H88_08190 [Vicinamibacterales bacterium]
MAWLITVAERVVEGPTDERSTPAEDLADQLGDEIAAAMARCGASQRKLGANRRTLARALAGDDVRLSSVAVLADLLGCVAEIRLVPREGGANTARCVTTPCDGPTLDAGEVPT